MAATLTTSRPAAGPSGPVQLALRQFRFWLTNYRRTWRGTIITSFLSPVLYLGAMGVGLGHLVDARNPVSLHGISYLVFIAPGLLAAGAMETAMMESTFPVFAGLKWLKTYQAATASPLRPADLFRGHLLFVTMRLAMNAAVFLIVMWAFGAARSPWVLASLPAAVLTGLAFAAPIEAFTLTQTKETSFSMLFRFGMIPLFLFSGTFFPVTQLPAAVRPLAYITPLWHGVALCRSLSLGVVPAGQTALHVGYLVAVASAGLIVGHRTYRRRLYA